jgi:hypothetical protein
LSKKGDADIKAREDVSSFFFVGIAFGVGINLI